MGSCDRLTLNVGGQLFTTTTDTLSSLPGTRLGRLARRLSAVPDRGQEAELFFDRNPEVVNSILDFYRSGELHLPKHLCGHTLERELRFWEIPNEMIHECCHKKFESQKKDAVITDEIHATVSQCYETEEEIAGLSKRNWIWLIMEKHTMCTASKIWATVYFTSVMVSVTLYTLQSCMPFREYNPLFLDDVTAKNSTVDAVLGAMGQLKRYTVTLSPRWLVWSMRAMYTFFVLEFLVRFFTCPSKRYFIRQGRNWLDILINLHFGLSMVLESSVIRTKTDYAVAETNGLYVYYAISVLRIMRLFYLANTFNAMKVLLLSTRASVKVLALLTVCLLSLAAIFGAAAFLAEAYSDEFTFVSIPHAVWYAIVTMTTVGYGDVYPTSTAGRVVGSLCALCGVVVMALPISVLATTFNNYHDMIGHVLQRKRRAAFVKDNPEFRAHREPAGTSAEKPPGAKQPAAAVGQRHPWENSGPGAAESLPPRRQSWYNFGFAEGKPTEVQSPHINVSDCPREP